MNFQNEDHNFKAAQADGGSIVIFCSGCGEVRPLALPQVDEAADAPNNDPSHATHDCGTCDMEPDGCDETCA